MADNRINDFVIKVANVNGTGSASANGLLMKSIFRMGIPVVGKNFFPSNIQGLPTWYEIRVTKDGYSCRTGSTDIMVAMNAETYQADLDSLPAGGVLIYDSTWPRKDLLQRDDVTVVGIPFSAMCNEAFDTARAKVLMKNVAYVGALVALLDIEMPVVEGLLQETFSSKPHLMDSNMQAIQMGYDYAVKHFDCPLNCRLERLDKTDGYVMVDGNTTAGLGAVYAGATVVSWYPITPSTSLIDAFSLFCKQLRVDNSDENNPVNNYCVIQAEDELAAIGMVLGANWNGARAFTSTSGPGISLMSEFLGLAYYAEIPAVIFDVQRVGPSTGMPTRTQQCDITAAAYASHGDTRHVLLFPADPTECFQMALDAFDLAERLQTPVIVLSDLDIGMNDWMIPEIQWDNSYQPDRGKVYDAQALRDMDKFYRYLDVDGDAIPWRTLPGVDATGAYFVRGSGHNQYGGYTEKSDEYQQVLDRLRQKSNTAATLVPQSVHEKSADVGSQTRWAVISIGSCHGAVIEARDRLAADNVAFEYLRIKAFPFDSAVAKFIDRFERVYVIEQNRDAQLRQMLSNELEIDPARLVPLLSYDGMPVGSDFIVNALKSELTDQQTVSAG
ncbi:MAG: 2-oxoacid:acceptor oxidoreductase subunit alpha [Pseudomonadota bacterium]